MPSKRRHWACPGGGVKVYSALGGGGEFVLSFPRYFDPAATTEVELVVAAMFLVVDDEEALRELAAELLRQKDYRVARAADARQAL
ncbi:MAG: hypothetical protein AB9Q22_06545 [Candidatus Reddybacter sp.]